MAIDNYMSLVSCLLLSTQLGQSMMEMRRLKAVIARRGGAGCSAGRGHRPAGLLAVRQIEPGIAFVVFTVNAEPASRKRYLGEGAQSFLDKTTECDQLVSSVEQSSCYDN